MPDGDVGSATTHPEETISANGDAAVTRPEGEATPSEATASGSGAAPTAPTPRPPRRRGRLIGATPSVEGAEPAAPAGNGAATPPRVKAPSTGGEPAPAVFDDQAPGGNGAAARRSSMSARLGSVPDAPKDADGPLVVRPNSPEHPSDTADPTDPVLLVPEVLAPTAPGVAPRIVPAMPDIVPAPQPDVIAPQPIAPPPLAEPEAELYDLAEDDPALVIEPPVRIRRRRPRVRRVTRVVRTIDTWSVFKVALLFSAVLYLSALISGVLLWNVAYATGTVDNAERFMESFGWQTFEFHGGEIFHDAWIIGMFAAAGLTGLAVLAAATFNLVSDIVGGVRVTVLEEEMVVRPVTRRRKQRIRKAPPRAATATTQQPVVAPHETGTGLALHHD